MHVIFLVGYAKLEWHIAGTATTWRPDEQTWTVKKVCVQLISDHYSFLHFILRALIFKILLLFIACRSCSLICEQQCRGLMVFKKGLYVSDEIRNKNTYSRKNSTESVERSTIYLQIVYSNVRLNFLRDVIKHTAMDCGA